VSIFNGQFFGGLREFPEWVAAGGVVVEGPNAAGNRHSAVGRKAPMGIILLVLLLALILGGLGFAVHVLWWIALAVLIIWLVGFVVRAGEGASRGRWYRW
jgi:hypothetical protein